MKNKCPVCTNEMVEARLTRHHESYLYCRTCKKELKEMQLVDSIADSLESVKMPSINVSYGLRPSVLASHVATPCGYDPHYGNDVHWYIPIPNSAQLAACTCGQYDENGYQLATPHPTVPFAQYTPPAASPIGCSGNRHFFPGSSVTCACKMVGVGAPIALIHKP